MKPPAFVSSGRVRLGILTVLLAACGGDGGTPPPPPAPAIGLSASSITVNDTAGTSSPAAVTVNITNAGDASLTGIGVSGITYGAGASGWLNASLSGADAPASLSLAPLNTGLAGGTYTATVPVTAGSAVNSPQNIVVTYVVAAAPAILIAGGDIAMCDKDVDEQTAALLDALPGTIATLGDNAYPNGTAAEFANCYDPSWGRHKARTRPSAGNHEYNTPGATGYYGYFGAAAGDPAKGYYSYDLGSWHIIVLNSNILAGEGSSQLTWLRQDLAAASNKCTLAYWHHPRFTSGLRQSTTGYSADLFKALYDANADLVLTAHDHFYERLMPQDAAGNADAARGIRQFIVGMAGSDANSAYQFGTILATSEVRQNIAAGVLKLTLWPDRYDWQYVPVAGANFTDTGSTTCH